MIVIVSSDVLGRVTQWDSTLHSELEGSGSNPTNTLAQALEPNLTTRLPVIFGSNLK